MEERYLTVKETATLKGCSIRNVQKLIERGKLTVVKMAGQSGQGGMQYRIPLSALPENLRHKYIIREKTAQRQIQCEFARKPAKAAISQKTAEPEDTETYDEDESYDKSESLSSAERNEIAFWKQLLDEWLLYRNTSSAPMEQADEDFIILCEIKYPERSINRRTLYRKQKALKDGGEIALADKRGKHGNHNKKLVDEVWDIFEVFYLDESRKSVSLCATLTYLELERQMEEGIISQIPEFPAISTFTREVTKIPIPFIEYFRHGRKSFISKCSPYIKRMYDDLNANAIWVADNHTFDVMVNDSDKTVRLYLTAFMDVRTRKFTGWCVTDRPCSDATIYALKRGIEKNGIPDMIYTDNGREFLFHDFGGNGFRRKKAVTEEFTPPSILTELGIAFKTALPTNARAKGVERAFKTVKDTFSKLFEAYTGGSVAEKPERLKDVVKSVDKLKTVEEFINFTDTYIEGWYNKQPHSGEGMSGMSPDEAFGELLIEKRTVTKEQLNRMLMRWSNPMKVGKNGVTLTFYGKKLQYFDDELWMKYFGEEVYVRYDPHDLASVRVYDINERFICSAQLKDELSYAATKDAIAENQKLTRAAVKKVGQYIADKGIKNHDALELMLAKAAENIEEGDEISPKVLKPIFEGVPLAKAAGDDTAVDDEIDWTSALDWVENIRNATDYED